MNLSYLFSRGPSSQPYLASCGLRRLRQDICRCERRNAPAFAEPHKPLIQFETPTSFGREDQTNPLTEPPPTELSLPGLLPSRLLAGVTFRRGELMPLQQGRFNFRPLAALFAASLHAARLKSHLNRTFFFPNSSSISHFYPIQCWEQAPKTVQRSAVC